MWDFCSFLKVNVISVLKYLSTAYLKFLFVIKLSRHKVYVQSETFSFLLLRGLCGYCVPHGESDIFISLTGEGSVV